ncbi:MAG: porin [Candidatus Zixiibacteriota bacterium]
MKYIRYHELTLTLSMLAGATCVTAGQVETKNADKLTISGYTQARFGFEDMDDSSAVDNAIFIKRSRAKLAAQISERTTLVVQLDFASSSLLKDAFVTFSPADAVTFTAGQFKRPFSREELASSSKTPTLDRGLANSLSTGLFYGGRDQGLAVTLRNKARSLRFTGGIFSGVGEKGVSSGDKLGSAQSDAQNRAKDFAARLDYSPGLAWGTLNVAGNLSLRTAGANYLESLLTHSSKTFSSFGGDAQIELQSGLTVIVEALSGDDFTQFDDTLASFTAPTFFGGHLAALFHAKMQGATTVTAIQPEARLEIFDPNTDIDNDGSSLFSGGVSLFFGKNMRWRNNITVRTFQDDLRDSETTFGSELQGLF